MPALAARLAVPDLAAVLAIVTLVWCLFIFDGGRNLFRDSDTGWHIRTGESILDTRLLPRADPYSFTRAGDPWVDWEWGADVLMGWAHRIDGLRGVATLGALTISACSWLWVKLHWAAGGDFFVVGLMAPPMITTASLHWLARPHVLSWVLLLGTLWYAERARVRAATHFGIAQWALVAAWSAVWANVHASFFLAPLLALVYMTARPGFFAWAFTAAAAGTFLNPYGWHLHAHVFTYLTNGELLDRIAEFQSFNFHVAGAGQVIAVVGLAAIGGTLALVRRNIVHFLLTAIFFVAALRSARALPLLALAILPLSNGAIRPMLESVRRLRSVLAYSGRLRAIDLRLNGAAFAGVAVAICLLAFRAPALAARIGFPADEFPAAAADAVSKLPLDARILAPDKFGGYLIYRFDGTRRVFFDGRSDFYGAQFMKQYIDLMEVRPGWQEILSSFHFTHALLPDRASLRGVLERDGWRVLYKDRVATLLGREAR